MISRDSYRHTGHLLHGGSACFVGGRATPSPPHATECVLVVASRCLPPSSPKQDKLGRAQRGRLLRVIPLSKHVQESAVS
mmetsp:Transcript_19335/g.68380  ORF Transcript_19335/g.68380 Transcript_19335/m.68380 type:complete len:80 (-) Transcript_19335:257-496(-)